MKRALLLAAITLGSATLARADTMSVNAVAIFQNIAFTIPPATVGSESFAISFEWDSAAGQLVPGTLAIATVGPLGPFTLQFGPDRNLLDLVDPLGDQFQINFSERDLQGGFDQPGVYPGDVMFVFCGASCGNGPLLDGPSSGQVVVTDVPEPSSLTLVVAALFVAILGALSANPICVLPPLMMALGLLRKRLRSVRD